MANAAAHVVEVEGFWLAPQQKRLWLLQRDGELYASQCVARLEGPLDKACLRAALHDVVACHEILRTSFVRVPGMEFPVQAIADGGEYVYVEHPQPTEVGIASEDRVHSLAQEERRSMPTLDTPARLRACLIQTGSECSWLVLTLPALCADAWSLGNLLEAVAAAYAARRSGATTAAEPVQYVQFSEWQNELLSPANAEAEPGREYWRAQLNRGSDTPGSFPDSATPPGAHRTEVQRRELTADLGEALAAFAKRTGVEERSALFAAWLVLLARLADWHRSPTFVCCHGRAFEEMHTGLGLYERWPRLCLDAGPDFTFVEIADAADRSLREALEWQEFFDSGEEEGEDSQASIRGIGFDFLRSRDPWQAGSVRWTCLDVFTRTDAFRLRLSVLRERDRIVLRLYYDPRVCDQAQARLLLDRIEALLRHALAQPLVPLAALQILTGREQASLAAWNDTAAPVRAGSLPFLFERQVEATPDAIAVVSEDACVSYAALNQRANQLARHLRRLGVTLETAVALGSDRSIAALIGIWGALKAGGAVAPLDLWQPEARLRAQLEELSQRAQPLVVLAARPGVRVPDGPWVRVDISDAGGIGADLKAEDDADLGVYIPDQAAAYVIYTSGSTGRPKGTIVPHLSVRHLDHALDARVYMGTAPPRRVSLNAPLTFDASVKQWIRLLRGDTLVLVPEDVRADGTALSDWIAARAVDVFDTTPAQVQLLVDPLAQHHTALSRVLVGGEAISANLWSRLSRVADGGVANVYGPTECTVDATIAWVRGGAPEIGTPLPNVCVHVLDRGLQPVPLGTPGELYIGGLGVARGYTGPASSTAARFVPDPFSSAPGARLYRTGDRARWTHAGALLFLGRTDHQTKVRGHRIELGEIEAALREHPAVKDAVVVTRDAGGDTQLLAYLVARETIDPAAIRAHMRAMVPEYMLPMEYAVIPVLPLTPHGKVDRKALPSPESCRAVPLDEARGRTQIEEVLAEILSATLGLAAIGRHESFFERGGHSLLATQVMSRIRQVFQIDVPLRTVFEAPTVEGLAQRVEAALGMERSRTAGPRAADRRPERLPLSFAQQRLWFLHRLAPEDTAYNSAKAARLRGVLKARAFEGALREIQRRHEVLRTRFPEVDGMPVQEVLASAVTVPVVDLRGLSREAREHEARRLTAAEARRPFALVSSPALRARLLRLADDDHALLLTMHHIVGDAWSFGVLTREVAALYDAYRNGRPSPVPELELQYADYALWQREWLTQGMLEQQLSYWQARLRDLRSLDLPTDRPRVPGSAQRGGRIALTLPPDLARRVREAGREAGATPFMTLLAIWQALLGHLAQMSDVVVGAPIAGRRHVELEPLVGVFINPLVLRLDLSGDPTLPALLQRVRETALGAYAHQDLPFEQLVASLEPTRTSQAHPLFQVLFVVQNTAPPELSFPGLTLTGLDTGPPVPQFDLMLALEEVHDRFQGFLTYNADLFNRSTARRWARQFESLVAAWTRHPALPLHEALQLSGPARHQLLLEWNDTETDSGWPSLRERFDAQQRAMPDATALVCGSLHVSYAAVSDRAARIAHALRRGGVRAETRVAVCMTRSADLVIALLGILEAGAAYVPLDPDAPRARLEFMVHDCGAPVLVTDGKARARCPVGGDVRVMSIPEDCDGAVADENDPPGRSFGAQLAYMIYTSGSTGQPKGVMITHGGLINYLAWSIAAYRLGTGRGAPVHSTLSTDLMVTSVWTPLLAGERVVIVPEQAGVDGLRDLLAEEGDFTLVKLTPALVDVLRNQPPSNTAGYPRALVIGGEALHEASLQWWRRHASATRLINEYGPTETVVGCCVHEARIAEDGTVPIGRPVANTCLYVLDGHLQPVPIGAPGELYIGGRGVARGYWRQPALTAERFVPDPFGEPGMRLYRTGDRARYRPDGTLEFHGRLDTQVKLRGYRIELGEIESVLRSHPDVHDAAAIVAGDGSDRRLVAYVAGERLDEARAREHLRRVLPEYMVPSQFVVLPRLPLTQAGKIDRRALPAPVERAATPDAPACDEVEAQLCRAWCEVLGRSAVGVADNFFDVGGHSLRALELMWHIKNRFQVMLPLSQIFETPTIRQLAAVLRAIDKRQERPSVIVNIHAAGNRVPLFCIHALAGHVLCYDKLARALGPDQPFFGIQNSGTTGMGDAGSIEAMAALYVQAIRQLRPSGPYRLGGWSMGGLVAFEMARQLRACGAPVDYLALIDTPAPDSGRTALISTARPLAWERRLIRELGAPAGTLHEPTLRRNAEAAARYAGGAYEGDVVLFRTRRRARLDETDANRRWDRFVRGRIRRLAVPGDHYGVLREPHVRVLAELMSSAGLERPAVS
jgi:amino acid adenylation domain-containing protein